MGLGEAMSLRAGGEITPPAGDNCSRRPGAGADNPKAHCSTAASPRRCAATARGAHALGGKLKGVCIRRRDRAMLNDRMPSWARRPGGSAAGGAGGAPTGRAGTVAHGAAATNTTAGVSGGGGATVNISIAPALKSHLTGRFPCSCSRASPAARAAAGRQAADECRARHQVRLSSADSMMPGRSLVAGQKVSITARISFSGQPCPPPAICTANLPMMSATTACAISSSIELHSRFVHHERCEESDGGADLEDNLFPYPRLRDKDREVLGMMIDAIDQFLAPEASGFQALGPRGGAAGGIHPGLARSRSVRPHHSRGARRLGLSNAGYARVLSQSSTHDSSVSLTIGAHSSIGMKGILAVRHARAARPLSAEARERRDDRGFCLTESGAGSDAASIRTRAEKSAPTAAGRSTARRSGSPTAASPISTRCSRALPPPAGKITAFIVEAAGRA
jgi:hypothetical protein